MKKQVEILASPGNHLYVLGDLANIGRAHESAVCRAQAMMGARSRNHLYLLGAQVVIISSPRNHRYQLASATSVALDRTTSKRPAMIPHSGSASPGIAGICYSMSRSCLLRSKECVVVSGRQRIALAKKGVVGAKTTLPHPKMLTLVLTYCLHIAVAQAV